ncbi:uncharacterized protein LOC118279833 isoform X2 [Spodoptera frugiperda]|uniref:Uncharacterized protein LOC118279833 isoform X2 n=1 Tax=Spodoptera frugiperda TaxID=7108 RepID=A0A9R0DIQ0_SPOFR|nr:uncharacterized protein LOC118279833 isoform X2 [Spodoptera frugiperda]
MMDLKEIIKWFIPCFHILLMKKVKMCRFIFICLFLLFILRPSYASDASKLVSGGDDTKNAFNYYNLDNKLNQSDYFDVKMESGERSHDTSVGRTFGRPLKKMVQALIPLAFQIGAASTWAVVAALVGVKTLLVALAILKLLLIAGAAKIGALFGQKAHGHSQGWEPPHQKEIHLHIHNGGHSEVHDEHVLPSWKQLPYQAQVKPLENGYYYNPPVAPTQATRRILNIKI